MPLQKSMLQLCCVQPYSPHLKKDVIEQEKIQKMSGVVFTGGVTVSPGTL